MIRLSVTFWFFASFLAKSEGTEGRHYFHHLAGEGGEGTCRGGVYLISAAY